MVQKLIEATQLLLGNLGLLSLIVLTVWLPGNIVVVYMNYHVFEVDDLVGPARLVMMIEGVFGPIYIGALVYALWRLKRRQPVTYLEAIGVGFRNWGRLFAARFVAGLIIGLGYLALIVPGIILSLRYAVLDSVVILEGADTGRARQRSGELTQGIKLQIFGAAVTFFIPFFLFSIFVYVPLTFITHLNTVMAVEVALDCCVDVAYAVIQITMFLFYWESRQREGGLKDPDAPPSDETEGAVDPLVDLGEIPDDDNPYRSPQF